jgi:putative phage-type endonuclease
MTQTLTLVQGTEEWHRHRILYRNASETAAVMGLSPWVSPYMMWEVKTGRRVIETSYPMERGMALEPKARAAYEEATGYIMEPAVMVDVDYSASLDGISLSGETVLEIKCPMKGKASETWAAAMAGKVEPHYMVQIQHQVMVSGAAKAHLYVYDADSNSGLIVEVLPDMDQMVAIQAAWNDFMKLVVSDTPPALTPMDTVIRDDAEWKAAAEAYISAKQAVDDAIARADQAKAELAGLAQHSSERGYGVAVCKYWKAKSDKQEVRVTITKAETKAEVQP